MKPLVVICFCLCICRGATEYNATQQLIAHLMKGYDMTVPPAAPVNVTLTLDLLKILNVDPHTAALSISLHEAVSWVDPNLQWNPEEFGGIGVIRIPANQLWMPDLSLYNREPGFGVEFHYGYHAILYSNGYVMTVPLVSRRFHCDFNMAKFPFDTQECEMTMGSWSYDSSQIDFTLPTASGTGAGTGSYRPHHSWKLISFSGVREETQYACCKEVYVTLKYKIVIERHSFFEYSTLAAPALLVLLAIPFVHGFVGSNILELTNVILSFPVFVLLLAISYVFPPFDDTGSTPILVELYLNILKTLAASTILMALNKILTGGGCAEMCATRCQENSCASKVVYWVACLCGVANVDRSPDADGQGMMIINSEESGDTKDLVSDGILAAISEARSLRQARETWMRMHMVAKRVCALGLLFYCAIAAASFPTVSKA